MIMVFGAKQGKLEVMPGFTLLHKCWCDEKFPILLKTSTIQTNRFCPKIFRISFLMEELECTGSWHNIFLAWALRQPLDV